MRFEEGFGRGVPSTAFPVTESEKCSSFDISEDSYDATRLFGMGGCRLPLGIAGALQDFHVVIASDVEDYRGGRTFDGVVVPVEEVSEESCISEDHLGR